MPEKEEQEIGDLFEKLMKENFSNLAKEIDMQVQEAQRVPIKLDLRKHTVPNKINPKRPTPRYIIIKIQMVKDRENLQPWPGSSVG